MDERAVTWEAVNSMIERMKANLEETRNLSTKSISALAAENEGLTVERDALREGLSELLDYVFRSRSSEPVAVRMADWQRVVDKAKTLLPPAPITDDD